MSASIEDIEDLSGEAVVERAPQMLVQPKRFTKKQAEETKEAETDRKSLANVPGTATVYLKTWGCSHNNSDGEYMAGQLVSSGYKLTSNKEEADVWLLNSCTVKNPSQDTFMNAVKDGKSHQKPVIVAGCVPQGQPKHKDLLGLSMIGVQQIDRVVEVVEEALQGHIVRLMGQKKGGGARLDLPKIRKNQFIEIIPINTGCLNQCTYCKTKHARGELRSYPPEEIVARAKQVIEEGVVEIWLTSEDTGTYGRDIGTSLPKLLWQLVEVLPDGVMLRVGMTNPPYILEHLDDMARILQHPRVYAFLHVPVQAASDHVLYDMRRQYTCVEFSQVVDVLCGRVPDMTIATDIICGFPTETPEDFELSLALVDKYKFPILNISQFYPRHGTPAARMKLIQTKEVKRRSRAMTALFESYETRSRKLGSIQRILVTEEATDKKHYVGHNKAYDQVLVEKRDDLLGKMIEVEVTHTGKHFLIGRVIEESVARAPVRPRPTVLYDSILAGKENDFGDDEESLCGDGQRMEGKKGKSQNQEETKEAKGSDDEDEEEEHAHDYHDASIKSCGDDCGCSESAPKTSGGCGSEDCCSSSSSSSPCSSSSSSSSSSTFEPCSESCACANDDSKDSECANNSNKTSKTKQAGDSINSCGNGGACCDDYQAPEAKDIEALYQSSSSSASSSSSSSASSSTSSLPSVPIIPSTSSSSSISTPASTSSSASSTSDDNSLLMKQIAAIMIVLSLATALAIRLLQ